MLAQIEQQVEQKGLFAAGFLTYEAAPAFDPHLVTHPPQSLPLLCFGLFDHRIRLDELPPQAEHHTLDWQSDLNKDEHRQYVTRIKNHIEAGDTYQVNYTTRMHAKGTIDLGTFIRIAGNSPYGAYIDGEEFTVVSASPELFFERDNNHISSKPMKGTASRGLSSHDDQLQANWLKSSQKNQAENLMITDMVRNDLSRIADIGSVTVSELFNVEQHPTVWQMTSRVAAQSNAPIVDLFKALFPGASITGAPKRASMALINQIEPSSREIYTGAIGLLAPGGTARFNIAIRTAWSIKRSNCSYYGAGGGIIWDSDPVDEYEELQLKTKILHSTETPFELLETMRWTLKQGIYLRKRHLARLLESANYFAYQIDLKSIEQALDDHTSKLGSAPQKIRLRIDKRGKVKIDSEQLVLSPQVQRLALATQPISPNNPLLYHKTTHREIYKHAQADLPEGFEALLHNTNGFITESNIANVIYELDGHFYTPPVSDGLLPGTLRCEMLAAGEIRERSLRVEHVSQVTSWALINALRGRRPAQLVR